MNANHRKTGKILPVFIFCLLPLFPLFPQDLSEPGETPEEDPWEEGFLFTEEEGLTVVGTTETSQQMAVIEQEEIQRRNSPDLAALLQETLDLGVTRYGGYGNQTSVNMRGFDSQRIAFLIDGVPVNSAQDGEFDINQISLQDIERIEVIYGGSDTKYNVSGALGGVINIVTLKKQALGLGFRFTMANTSALTGDYMERSGETGKRRWEDLLDTQNYTFSTAYGGKNISLTAGGFTNRAENHFIFKDYLGISRRKDHNEVWDTGASAALVWELPDLTKVLASSNFYYGDKNIPTSGFSSLFGVQQDASFRQNLMIDAPRAFRDDLAAEGSLAWHLTDREYAPPSGPASKHTQHSLSAINRWTWYPKDWLTLRIGGDYRFIYLDSSDMGLRDRHDGGIYLTGEYKPASRLLIIPSIKGAFSSGKGAAFAPVPKLGFIWEILDSLTLKNNYFRSFKIPDFEDLYWSGGGGAGNPELRAEDGWGGDIAAVWRFKELFRLESVFYVQWTEDSIHWSNASGTWRPENIGAAFFFGLDGKLRFDIPVSLGRIRKISPSVSYRYLRSYLLSYGYTFASDKRIPYMPEHTVGAGLDLAWTSGSLLISLHYESLRHPDTANRSTLDPYVLLNATVNQNIGKNIAAFGSLRNMLNQSYQTFTDYPMPGITLTLGLRMQFSIN